MNKSILSIMVLDDEPFMATVLACMLANQGYTSVITCGSGRAALDLIDGKKAYPDLILLDLNMPEMDGIEFLRHLFERHFTGSLILISGEDERTRQSAEKLALAHKISMLGHLRKPPSSAELTQLMEKWAPHCLSSTPASRKTYTADEVRSGIANGELVNYYQPKVEVGSARVTGVETLVRWRHPQDGMVFPDQFIGVAETNNLIDDLTRVVLSDALAQTKAWHESGLMLNVAINVSMNNLAKLDFVDFITEQAAAAGVPSKAIVLEITESQLMKDKRVPLEILTRLRLKRFRLSIDDFGTGHSSLSQLRDIPFDELKIDQSFVHRAGAIETLRAIFETSLALAKRLGIECVAEGVEDQADWDFLQGSGCDLAQGYFIARPMPADKIRDWITAWEVRAGSLLQFTGTH